MNTSINKLGGKTVADASRRKGHRDQHHEDGGEHEHLAEASDYIRLAVMAVVIVASLAGWWRHWMSRDWLAFAATLIGGLPIFTEALENLRKRRMTMELS